MPSDKSEITKDYKAAFLVLRNVFFKRDPAGLGTDDGDVPEDEYDMEIARILPLFSKGLSDRDLAFGIEQVFIDNFGGEKGNEPHDGFLSLIHDIRNALNEAGLARFLKSNE